jgi:hypothetical protein
VAKCSSRAPPNAKEQCAREERDRSNGLLTNARKKVERVVSTPEMPRTVRMTTFGEPPLSFQ